MQFNKDWLELVWRLLGFTPNETQAAAVWAILEGKRFLLICGGERAGKSFTTSGLSLLLLQPTDMQDLGNSERRLCWIVGPDYRQARAEFEYLHDALARGHMVEKVSMPQSNTSPWTCETIWNCRFETRSSSDIRKLASFAPDLFLMVEAAQQDYEVFLKAQGRVAQSKGHIILSGTLEQGLPWYGDLLRRWKGPNTDGGYALSLPTWSNTAIFPKGWDDPEIQRLYTYHRDQNSLDYFYERYGAEPRKVSGLVIPEFDYSKHVRELQPEENAPVELWIDPGKNAYAVLFVQVLGKVTWVLDRVYMRGAIAQDVIPRVMENPLWPLVQKNVGSHGVIDIAGKHQYGLPSHVEIWQRDAGIVLRSNYVHQDVGRDVVRFRLRDDPALGHPLLFFNSQMTNAKAPDGTAMDVLAEFELWKWRDTNTYGNEPRRPIDANNHAIKALGYGLYDKFGPTEERRFVRRRHQRAKWITI